MMNHRIHRQRWQVKAPSQQAAFALRQQLRDQLDDTLLPVFERAFDALAPNGEVIRIPLLTLDIRLHDSGDDLLAALAQALPDALHRQLHDALSSSPESPASGTPAGADHSDTEATPAGRPAPERASLSRLSEAERARSALLHYLATGRLIWHEQDARGPEAIRQMLCAEAARLAADPAALRAALIGTLAERLAASFRLLQLLDAGARAALLAAAAFDRTLPPHTQDAPGRNESAIGDSAATPLRIGSTLAGLLRYLAAAPGSSSHLLLRLEAMRLVTGDDDLRQPLLPAIVALLRDCQTALAACDGPEAQALHDAVAALLHDGAAPTEPDQEATTRPGKPDAKTEADYLADDAGLVLLHPFLPRLFAALDITRDGQLPEANLPRAAALLHWLVHGRDDPREYELCIVKILLGLSPDSPLPVGDGLLAAADRDEADTLLAAAIGHWAALGKTGAEALRTSFLQRRGLLHDSDSGWRLQLETAPFDLLLGRLPWSISIVRLPWMTRPLHTEWPLP